MDVDLSPADRTQVAGIDLAAMPWSYAGSWLNVALSPGDDPASGVARLVSHRGGNHELFRLEPSLADPGSPISLDATPTSLTWRDEIACVRAVFADANAIRFKTSAGARLRIEVMAPELTPFTGSYLFQDADGSVVITSYETGHRYRICCVHGSMTVHGDQLLGAGERGVLVEADSEVELREYRAGRVAVAETTFDDLQAQADTQLSTFGASLIPADSTPGATTELAVYLLWSSLVDPDGFVRRPSILMSKHWMDKIWAWDPCFNALALAAGQPDLALDQFFAMFDHQDATGAIPDSVAHSEVLFNFVKPPVHGWAFEQLRRSLGRRLTPEELRRAYEQLAAWTDFWLRHRRAAGETLCHYEHGNDSGWDNATVFDGARLVQTADLAAFLIVQLRVLRDLALELGKPDASAAFDRDAAAMTAALVAELWDGEQFTARAVGTGARFSSRSLLALLPLILGEQLPIEVRRTLLAAVERHRAPAGPATEPLSSAAYEADGYWRGPVWAPSTVLLVDGLRRCGSLRLAAEFARAFCRSCEQSGFAENFDARSAEGLRDRAYTWTASGYLLLRDEPGRPDAETPPSRR